MIVRYKKPPRIQAARWRGGKTLLGWTVVTRCSQLLEDVENYAKFCTVIKAGHGILLHPVPVVIHKGDWLVIGAGYDTGVYTNEEFHSKFEKADHQGPVTRNGTSNNGAVNA